MTVKEDRADSGQEQEWLRQDSLIYGGLLGVGVVCVQPFLEASIGFGPSYDPNFRELTF